MLTNMLTLFLIFLKLFDNAILNELLVIGVMEENYIESVFNSCLN